MTYYTNFLTLYNASESQINDIADRIKGLHVPTEVIGNSFLFGTSDVDVSDSFKDYLATLGLAYSYLFLYNPVGSYLRVKGVPEAVAANMEKILHDDF